jgi:hypothetical protein
VHHDETPGGGINDEVAWLGDGADQPPDQLSRLGMRVNAATFSDQRFGIP